MNINRKPKTEVEPKPVFEPFPEPRTMPEGWDLSDLLTGSKLEAIERSTDSAVK